MQLTLTNEHGFPEWSAQGTILRGWALAEQGQGEEGVAQMRQGLAAYQATGSELARAQYLALLAEAYERMGQPEERLSTLAEALAVVDRTGERYWEAELYRLKGELLLAQEGYRLQAEGLREKTEEAGRVLFTSDCHCANATSQIVGATRGHQPRPSLAAAGEERRSSQTVV